MKPNYSFCFGLSSSIIFICATPHALVAAEININSIARKSAVQISMTQSGAAAGSGVIVKRDGSTYTVLTAGHVVCADYDSGRCEEEPALSLTTADDRQYVVQSVKLFPGKIDLALLQFTTSSQYETVKIGNIGKVVRGDRVYASGFPGEWKLSTGKAIANPSQRVTKEGYDFHHDAETIPGMSGGGIFNSKGELIGINSRGSGAPDTIPNLASGIPISYYQNLAPAITGDAAAAAPELFTLGQSSFNNGKYDEAIEYFTKATITDRNFSEAYLWRGKSEMAMDKYADAVRSFDQAIRIDAKFPEAHYHRGLVYFKMKQYNDAIADYDQAIKINPQYFLAFTAKATTYEYMERYYEATVAYSSAIEIDPTSIETHYNRALAYEYLERLDLALDGYTQVIKMQPYHYYTPRALEHRAEIYERQLSYAKATEDYTTLIEIKSSNSFLAKGLYLKRAKLLKLQQDYPGAIADFDRVNEIDPAYSEAYLEKAKMYGEIGQSELAIYQYDLLIYYEGGLRKPTIAYANPQAPNGLSPAPLSPSINVASIPSRKSDRQVSLPQAHRERGELYLKLNNKKQALTDFQTAARLYQLQGNYEKADECSKLAQEIQQGLHQNPKSPRRR